MFAGKTLMSKSAEIFWTEDRLRQMAINELRSHGGNQNDLNRLREHFKKADEITVSDEDNGPQAGDIPA